MALPRLDDVDDLDAQHLLVLPSGIGPESVEILATSRFPRATWEHPAAPPQVGARAPRLATPPGVLRLSRLTTLAGPYQVDRGTATELGLPVGAGTAYLLLTPTERGNPPWAHAGGDRDGLARAFPDGLPVRDEARMLDWAIAVARRLAGAVRTAAGPDGRPPVVLTPDPAAAVDLTVWSDHWLDPDTALAVMRQAIPRAYLNLPRGTWQGPPPGTGGHGVPGTEPLTDAQRAWLHAEADAYDREMLANPAPMDTYGLLADLDLDGFVALEIAGEPSPPPVVAELPWAVSGAVAYRVRWEPVDETELEQERPSLAHRVARGRAAPLVVAVARAVHGKVGGEITDMMGFVVDPADL
jgi:hypothetical protein